MGCKTRGGRELSHEEMLLIQEDITEYEKGEVISFEEFISKRK